MKTIHAVFEGGVFRPLEAVDLPEQARVEFEPCMTAVPPPPAGDHEALYAILSERYESGERDVAARHNEHH